jgi:SAM-dependent methyltransferase
MITAFLRKVFPLYRTFRRVRPKRFRLFSYCQPPLLEDLPSENISSINESSEKYFQRTENEEYWRNKPFSDHRQAGWYLMRFGHLMAGLTPGPGSRILDFGCGTGWTSIMLAQTGAEVVGVDISDSALKIASENAQRVALPANASITFQNYDGMHLPFENESFNLAIIFEAFHHLPNQKTILSELNRVLWKHGRLGFAEPDTPMLKVLPKKRNTESLNRIWMSNNSIEALWQPVSGTWNCLCRRSIRALFQFRFHARSGS